MTTSNFVRRAVGRLAAAFAFAGALASAQRLDGHEGHAALPSSGAKVEGGRVLVSAEARRALGLTTAEAISGRLSRTVAANGSLAVPWSSRGFASSLVAGRVTDVLARPGDVVSAGAELLVIESADLTTVQFDYLQATSERALAERLLAQRRKLAEGGVVAAKELLAAETDLASRRAAEAIARRKLAALGVGDEAIDRLNATQRPSGRMALTSPTAGRVAWIEARVGQMIDPLVHVTEVVEPEKLWAVVDLPETALREVKTGQPVDLFMGGDRSASEPTGRGRIAGFNAAVAAGRWVLPTIVELDEHDPSQRAGMFGRVRVRAVDVEDAVLVPLAAVGDAATRPFVLVEEQEGSYLKTPVVLGLRDGASVQIVDGIYPGDRYVLRGGHELAAMFPRPQAKAAPAAAPRAATAADVVHAPGQVESPLDAEAFVAAKSAGRITRLAVKPGDRVEKGQLLAEVESLDLKTLQLELAQAIVRAAVARRDLERVRGLDQKGLAAQRQVWQAETDLANRANEVQTRRRQLLLAGLDAEAVERLAAADPLQPDVAFPWVESLPVHAPLAGHAASVPATGDLAIGHVVRPDQALISVVDLSRVWVRAGVAEAVADRVEVGRAARVRLTADPGFSVAGRVVRVAPTLDPDDRQLDLWIEVENADGRLRLGMLADAEIEVGPAAPARSRTAELSREDGARP